MDIAGVDTSYFVVSSFWAGSDKIIRGAMQTANDVKTFGDDEIWVFEYKR